MPARAATGTAGPPRPPGPSSPEARRESRARWRDPRLAVGVAVVALCALLGGRLLRGADATVAVWSARSPLAADQRITDRDLVARRIRFADQADADHYLSADRALPDATTLDRPVGAGELVPRAALAAAPASALTEVPISVGTEAVAATVHVGSTVDVWVTPDGSRSGAGSGADAGSGERRAGGRPPRATLVLHDVSVLSLPPTRDSLGPTATRTVVVGVGPDQQDDLPTTIAALSSGTRLLTSRR